MFYFGVDYYPEHWPEEHWSDDAPLMAEADINVVRLAEVAWSYLEPHPSHFDSDWLDRALDVLYAHGIQAILGTPTASPAAWVLGSGCGVRLACAPHARRRRGDGAVEGRSAPAVSAQSR